MEVLAREGNRQLFRFLRSGSEWELRNFQRRRFSRQGLTIDVSPWSLYVRANQPCWRVPGKGALLTITLMNQINSIVAAFLQGVRVQGTKAAPLFCVRDIAGRLGLTRGGIMGLAWHLPPEDRMHLIILAPGGRQWHLFITRTGFLRIAMGGRTAESKAFRAKVAACDLPKALRPVEMEMIKKPPKEVMALPTARRKHILFWISVTAEIAGSLRHHETMVKLARKHRRRAGVSRSSCDRYFRLWRKAGGDWRVFDRWVNLRRESRL